MDYDRARAIALELCSVPSVTDTEGESNFGAFLADYLKALPCFADNPDLVRRIPTSNDPRHREIVAALVRGEGREALILTGHYDVVSTAPYGSLEDLAFSPEALTQSLLAELRGRKRSAEAQGAALSAVEERALQDFESGAFLAGRGLLDMKSGLAAAVEAMLDFHESRPRKGNLIFLAVPDEEGSSHGMISAMAALPALLSGWGLEARLAVNVDAAVDQGSGEAGRAYFLGSVGKTHPFALFIGRPSHAGAPFDGINPALLAAEFVRRVECAPALLGGIGSEGEAPPPPTVLYHRELRTAYDVTSPESVFSSINVLSTERSPREVLAVVADLAAESMAAARGLLRERALLQSSLEHRKLEAPDNAARILRWSELRDLAARAQPAEFQALSERFALPGSLQSADPVDRLARFVAETAKLAGLEGPAAVIGLAPPYYPRAALAPNEAWISEAVAAEASALALETGSSIIPRPFFPGISDMSYLSPADPAEDRLEASAECPMGIQAPQNRSAQAGERIQASGDRPREATQAFRCPAVNIGPWGREYHQKLERVHQGYAFSILPLLLSRVARRVLG